MLTIIFNQATALPSDITGEGSVELDCPDVDAVGQLTIYGAGSVVLTVPELHARQHRSPGLVTHFLVKVKPVAPYQRPGGASSQQMVGTG